MRKSYIFFLFLLILLNSCERNYISSDYPTTYRKLSEAALSQMLNSYLRKNPHIMTSLNDFGFCGPSKFFPNSPYFTSTGNLSESQAIEVVKSFVAKNTAETGITEALELDFLSISKTVAYNGSVLWHFRSKTQLIDTVEVMYSEVLFQVENSEVTWCYGNWYPEIKFPGEFNFNQIRAKSSLRGKVLQYYTFGGGPYERTITSADLEKCSISFKIFPKEYDDRIELHLCWRIYLNSMSYIMYVDVMSGELIYQEPTIIS